MKKIQRSKFIAYIILITLLFQMLSINVYALEVNDNPSEKILEQEPAIEELTSTEEPSVEQKPESIEESDINTESDETIRELIDEENVNMYADAEEISCPEISLEIIDSSNQTVITSVYCVDDKNQDIVEYGLIYSHEYEYPSFSQNQEIIKIGEGSFESFDYKLESKQSVFIRAYVIYNENKVCYSNQVENYEETNTDSEETTTEQEFKNIEDSKTNTEESAIEQNPENIEESNTSTEEPAVEQESKNIEDKNTNSEESSAEQNPENMEESNTSTEESVAEQEPENIEDPNTDTEETAVEQNPENIEELNTDIDSDETTPEAETVDEEKINTDSEETIPQETTPELEVVDKGIINIDAEKAAPEEIIPESVSRDYNNLIEIERNIMDNTEILSEINEEEISWPKISLEIIDTYNEIVTTSVYCVDDKNQDMVEYGLVYSYDYEYPSFSQNQGVIKIGEGSFDSFDYKLESEQSVFIRAYVIYDENKVCYSNQVQNYDDNDQAVLMVNSLGSCNFLEPVDNGQVIHKDSGDDLDKLAVGLAYAAGIIKVNLNVDRLPEESAYLVLKGNFGGFADLTFNGEALGYVNTNILSEYFAFKVPLENIVEGNNEIEMLVYFLGWGYIDSTTLIFDGGDQSKGKIEEIDFEDWNIRFDGKEHKHYLSEAKDCPGRYYTDLYAKTILSDINGDEDTRLVGSVGEFGYNHITSDEFVNLNTSLDKQSYNYHFKIIDDHYYDTEEGYWQAYSIIVDGKKPLTVNHREFYYEDNVGPRNFGIIFSQNTNEYTNEEVTIEAAADDLFGKPFGYLEDPSGNKIYDYSTNITVNENGEYRFKTVEPDGRETTFTHKVTNIDKIPPTISLIGDSTVVILEEEQYADLGVNMSDDLSGLISNAPSIDYGGLNINSPEPGNYTITYEAADRAGNTSTQTREVIVKNKPLTMETDAVTKSEDLTQAIFKGNIEYFGEDVITEKGFVWSLTKNPTIDNNDGIQSWSNGLHSKDVFIKNILISELLPGAAYSVRTYAKTESNRVVYGKNQTFTADDKAYGAINFNNTVYTVDKGSSISFSINRTDGTDGEIKVYYRTVDASALNGQQYIGKSGSVTFKDGETGSKSIRVNTLDYNTWQKVNRQFYFEIYKVEGGANIGSKEIAKVTFDNDVTSIGSINNSNWQEIWSTSTKYQSEKNKTWYAPDGGLSLNSDLDYWRTHANSFLARGYGDINTNAADVRFRLEGYINNTWQSVGYTYFSSSDDWEYTKSSGSNVVNASKLRLKMDVTNAGGHWDDGGVHKPKIQLKISDTTRPRIEKYSVPLGNYVEGQTIYIAVKFSEIVTGSNLTSTKLNLKLYDENNQPVTKEATYVTGNNTDTLVYQYTVEEGVNAERLEYAYGSFVNKGDIIDLAGNKFNDSVSGIIMNNVKIASVDHNINFTPNGGEVAKSHSVTVNVTGSGIDENKIIKEYLWSESTDVQTKGFKAFENNEILTIDGATGIYYLHIRTEDEYGNKTYKISNGYQLNNVEPSFSLEASTNDWTNKDVTINICNIPNNAAIISKQYVEGSYTVNDFPTEGTTVFEGNSFTVSDNNGYSVLIETSMGMKYVNYINITNIDRIMPSITIGKENTAPEGESSNAIPNGSNGQEIYKAITTAEVNYIGQSGIASLEYLWTNNTSKPTSGWISFKSGEILEKTNNGTWYLHVRTNTAAGQEAYACSNAFIINNEGPTISVTADRELTEWTNEPLILSVTAQKESGLNRVLLPDGNMVYDNDKNDTNNEEGIIETEYKAAENKYYIFRAVDSAGNTSEANINVTKLDTNPPNIEIMKSEKDWTSDDIELTITINDLTSPTYNEDGVITNYGGVGSIQVKGFEYTTFKNYTEPIQKTISENGTYQISTKDALGNQTTRNITITNIDKNPPYVETTNTDFSAKSECISTSLIFRDLEMGLVRDKKYKITNSTETPDSYDIYNGKVINLTKVGTYYIHYLAKDGAGNTASGYFGPYTIDATVPTINITSEYTGAKKSHNALISVNYNGLTKDRDIKYQWTNSIDTPYVGWNNTTSNNNTITKSDVNGTYYLHVMVSAGGAVYYGTCSFIFDNQAPNINLKGNNPYTMNYGEIYIENGITYNDNIDLWPEYTVPSSSLVQNEVPGFYDLIYTVTDKAGNVATAARQVIVKDPTAPIGEDFNITVAEDNDYVFSFDLFNNHYEDITNLQAIIIKSLTSNGSLKLNNVDVKNNDIIPVNELGSLIYAPDENYYGSDAFTYQMVDSGYIYDSNLSEYEGNCSEINTVNLNITSVNDIPVVENDYFETDEDISITNTTLMANNDTDVEGELTIINITQPSNGSSQLNADGTITYTPNNNFNGTDIFTYTIEDTDKVQATAAITVKVNPVNDAPFAPTNLNVLGSSQYSGGQNITLNWSGANDIDEDELVYNIDYFNGSNWNNIAEYVEGTSYSFKLPNDDINNGKVRVAANDRKLSSIDYKESSSFMVDSTAPENPGFSMNSSDWTSGNITVSLNGGDDTGSGRNRYEYSTSYSSDNITWSSWSNYERAGEINLTNDGLHKIKARAIDNVGNISDAAESGIYKIDKTIPKTFNVEAEALSESAIKAFGLTSDDDTINANSGLAENPFRYAENIEAAYQYTEYDNLGYHSFENYNANEQHTFKMKIVDRAGNEQTSTNSISKFTLASNPLSTNLISWDNDTLVIDFAEENNRTNPTYSVWLTKQYDTAVVGTKTNYANKQDSYTFDNLEEDTAYDVWIQTRNGDNIENEPVKYSTYKTNKKPELIINNSSKNLYYKAGETITITGTVLDKENETVTIKGSIYGVEKSITINNTDNLQNWTLTWDLSEVTIDNGNYKNLSITAADERGESIDDTWNENVITIYTGDIFVDTTIPDPAKVTGTDYDEGWSNRDSETIAINASDELSGLGDIKYSLGGAETKDYTSIENDSEVTVSAEGITTVNVKVYDKSGNVSDTAAYKVRIDRTNPNAAPTNYTGTFVNSGSKDTVDWTKDNYTIDITYNDERGIDEIYYVITDSEDVPADFGEEKADLYDGIPDDGNYSLSNTQTVNINTDGTHYIHYKVKDLAGNTYTGHSGPYKLDKIIPTINFIYDGTENNIKKAHSTIVTVADQEHLSGILKSEYIWTQSNLRPDENEGFTIFQSGSAINKIDGNGEWYLWIKTTDTAGNIYYQCSDTDSELAGNQAFKFDNTMPNVDTTIEEGGLYPSNILSFKAKAVDMPTKNNSGLDYFKYQFSTNSESPDFSKLEQNSFETFTNYLNFDGFSFGDMGSILGSIKNRDISLAFEFRASHILDDDLVLLSTEEFNIGINGKTGAILTSVNNEKKYFGGGYNDGLIHKLTVTINKDEQMNVFVDGRLLGSFDFTENINWDAIANAYVGKPVNDSGTGFFGEIYRMKVFARQISLEEGKAFVFNNNNLIGDYIICHNDDGLGDNNTIHDRSDHNYDIVITGTNWSSEYKRMPIMDFNGTGNYVNLDYLQDTVKELDEISIKFTFKNDINAINGQDTLVSLQKNTDASNIMNIEILEQGYININDGTDHSTTKEVNDGIKHEVILTFDNISKQGIVYIDGQKAAAFTSTNNLNETDLVSMGQAYSGVNSGQGTNPSKYFDGEIYNVSIFNRVIEENEALTGNIDYRNGLIANYYFSQNGIDMTCGKLKNTVLE